MGTSSYVPGTGGHPQTAEVLASSGRNWSVAPRMVFRFVFPFLLLVTLPFPFGKLPGDILKTSAYEKLWYTPTLWVAKHILHFPPSPFEFILADTSTGYADLLCFAVLAGLVAIVWTVLDRKHTEYRVLHEYLRIYVRYMLAFTMLAYGLDKVFALQFMLASPGPERLAQPFGNYSPSGLLWAFMGYSTAYTRFTGIGEVIGGLLLFFRRTTTLGALIICGVMANVVMLNFSYLVPVKILSSLLLLLAIFLVAPDVKRLLNVFVLNRAVPAASLEPRFRRPWMNTARVVVKAVVLIFALYWFSGPDLRANRQRRNEPKSPLYGLYQVEAFTENGQPPAPSDSNWRRLIFEGEGTMTVITMDDSTHYFPIEYDKAKNALTLSGEYNPDTDKSDKSRKEVLTYSRPDPEHLDLGGNINNQPVMIKLRKVDISKFPLMSSKFHWIGWSR